MFHLFALIIPDATELYIKDVLNVPPTDMGPDKGIADSILVLKPQEFESISSGNSF